MLNFEESYEIIYLKEMIVFLEEEGKLNMNIIIGLVIVMTLLLASIVMEKRLKSIMNQNRKIIKLLEEIRDKK